MENFFNKIREQSKESGKKYGVLVIISAVIFVILMTVSIVILVHRIGKTKVTVKYAPFAAEVKINGTRMINNSVNYLSKGTYKVEVTLEHFEKVESEIVVGDEDVYSIGLLTPSDSDGEKIRSDRDKEYKEVEKLSGKVRISESEKKIEKNQILQYLPYNTKGYSVGYVWMGEELVVDILVRNESYYGTVIYNLYNFSDKIKPAEYQIMIEDYIDVFDKISENSNTDINRYIEAGFGEKFKNYKIYKVLEQDNYIGLIISKAGLVNNSSSDDDGGVVYRMIIKKEGNGFKTIANPYPIVSKYNAKDVPVDFLDRVNNIFYVSLNQAETSSLFH